MTRTGLPKRVYLKHGRYWYVAPTGKWHGLTREREGLPAMYRALAALVDTERVSDLLPAVLARWADSKRAEGKWESSTERDMVRAIDYLSKRFAEFRPAQVTTPIVFEALKPWLGKARSFNRVRSVLKQAMSFAALEGLREGHNPVDDVPQRILKKRIRIVTPAELDAMAKALMQAKRGGPAHVRMLGLCIKTGQRIGDVLKFRAQDITDDGLLVTQGKTGEPLVIEWDAELRELVEACFVGRDKIGPLLVQSTGKAYRYAGVRSAWVRAMERAGIEDLHIHDLRGEAGARLADTLGSYAAQILLGHASVKMTEHYIRGKTRRRATPAPLTKASK